MIKQSLEAMDHKVPLPGGSSTDGHFAMIRKQSTNTTSQ